MAWYLVKHRDKFTFTASELLLPCWCYERYGIKYEDGISLKKNDQVSEKPVIWFKIRKKNWLNMDFWQIRGVDMIGFKWI
jgi:hypothetical protein